MRPRKKQKARKEEREKEWWSQHNIENLRKNEHFEFWFTNEKNRFTWRISAIWVEKIEKIEREWKEKEEKEREERDNWEEEREKKKIDSWRIDKGNCLSVDPTLSIDNTLSPAGQGLSSLQATFESSNMTNPEGHQDCQLDWVKMAEIFVLQTQNHCKS